MRTRLRRAMLPGRFDAGQDALLRSGGGWGPKELDPDTPPLIRVLPSTGGARQYLFRNKEL